MNPNHIMAADVSVQSVGRAYALKYDPRPMPTKEGPVYFRTDLPDGYTIEGREGNYLLGTVQQRKSNLNIVTISLVGDGGVLYCHDSLDTNEAIRTMEKMKAAASVNYESIGTVYVGE